MKKYDIAVLGMAVMGKNLALNIADHGYQVAVYNRTAEVAREVVSQHPHLGLATSLEALVDMLSKPRKLMIMVKAGAAVDAVIDQLVLLLDQGDILIDAGNTFFADTIRRENALAALGIHFIGMGVSGGEEGARFGPAIMPSGQRTAHAAIQPILEAISAKVDGEPCTAYIGENGAGHYVKMVHNGIEYGDMQLIAESYHVLKHVGQRTNAQLATIFEAYNQGPLDSYLIQITADIFNTRDDLGEGDLIDKILDTAGQKGTGLWTSKEALDLGVNISVITAAVNARLISADRNLRRAAYTVLPQHPITISGSESLDDLVGQALYVAKVISYAQGFDLLAKAQRAYGWTLDFKAIAKLFRGGCIIRAKFLNQIAQAFEDQNLENLLLDPFFAGVMQEGLVALRHIVAMGSSFGVPMPAFSAALSYYDAFRSTTLSTNLIQAQRDYFGAHTYQRTDREGNFHYDHWGKHD
jgi:6-phosphogluconate dehydrogenase